jgi:hypothetical protein
MSEFLQNRPFKYGPKDRVEFIVYNSEMMILCENDAEGNPIYIGRAKIGSSPTAAVWQISFHTYDANNSLLSKTWPVNSVGAESANYEFVWANRASYTYA